MTYPLFFHGAEGETRTPTGEPPLDPEPSVSANSTTSALLFNMPSFPLPLIPSHQERVFHAASLP